MRFTQNNNNGFELLDLYNKRINSLNLTISSTLNKRADILISIKCNHGHGYRGYNPCAKALEYSCCD